jgi:diadenosine tetraphosphate (Ap4A) HIT family hydrolase
VADCLICSRIDLIKNHQNPYSVAELKTGYVVLGDSQSYKGYTLFLSKEHVKKPYDLDSDMSLHMQEVGHVDEAVYMAFHPRVVNLKCEGNVDPHLHWHMYPRYEDDPYPYETVEVARMKILEKTGKDIADEKLTESQLPWYKIRLKDALNSLAQPVRIF